jgi:hypothetical protein
MASIALPPHLLPIDSRAQRSYAAAKREAFVTMVKYGA